MCSFSSTRKLNVLKYLSCFTFIFRQLIITLVDCVLDGILKYINITDYLKILNVNGKVKGKKT